MTSESFFASDSQNKRRTSDALKRTLRDNTEDCCSRLFGFQLFSLSFIRLVYSNGI